MSCTAAHLRSRSWNIVSLSDMIEGSYRSWDLYTTGQLVDGLQQKRKPVFIKRKWNHVVFSRVTILSFDPLQGSYCSWDLYTTGQLVDGLQQKKKENRFSLNGNGIISSFLGRQFYHSTLYLKPYNCVQIISIWHEYYEPKFFQMLLLQKNY